MPEKLSPRQEQNIRYWTEFCDYLSQLGSQLQSQTSKERHFIDFRIGIRCFLRARQVIKAQCRESYRNGPTAITVGFIMKGRARTYFHSLEEQREEIESQFGESLEWFAEWETEKHVTLRKEADPRDENDWPRQHEWLATKLEKLNEVFRPRIERLKADA